MRARATTLVAMGLASCAPALSRQRSPNMELAALIAGSEPKLTRFESAARACGATTRRVQHRSGLRMVAVERAAGEALDNPRINCVIEWIMAHPDGLSLVGNGPRE